jgi:dTDP-4-amino-4,6-dideoxygalactose transaminase
MKNKTNPIYVTQPSLPPLEEFVKELEKIWDSKYITNQGSYHKQLEKELAKYLGVKYISLFSNGTLALLIALKALNIKGEVITTPFSFVATTHSLWWNNIKPVFVDIEANHLNLDASLIEKAITSKTTAIMPVHVYGNPCDVKELERISKKHNLKIIYDAAHAFNVKINNNSVLNYGDLSVLSFHATKVFNTIEGGAIVSHTKEMKEKVDMLKNFGITSETTVEEVGINAKMNELQAAYGLLQLDYVDEYIEGRRKVVERYREGLKDIEGITYLEEVEGVKHNYAYFPILINKEKYGISRDEVYDRFKQENIHGRRYFYPLISKFDPYKKLKSSKGENLPVAEEKAEEVLCLPLYDGLEEENIDKIIYILNQIKS